MKKLLHIAVVVLLYVSSGHAVPVTPAVIPRITFVNGAGLPCAGCKLYTYAAGTTTPLATYTDSTGSTQNTNPIILDASGGANIWVGANSYKFILKDALGSTIWSVDNVNAGNLFPCGAAGAVQISSGSSGLSCDANITINTTSHTLSIGTLGANYVTIGALGTPTSWTFDTTTPATALASLGAGGISAGTINQLAFYPAAGSNLAGTSAIPSAITGTTQSPSDNSTKLATTAYVALPGAINPTSLQLAAGTAMTGNQGTGMLVQHSTGATVAGHSGTFDATGNIIDSGFPLTTYFATTNDVTGSRSLAIAYQNTGTTPMYVSGYATIHSGSGDSTITFLVGALSPSTNCDSSTFTGTVSGEHVGFRCMVPAGSFYEVTGTNLINAVGSWTETQ